MAWTEQDYQEIEARLKENSQGVGDVPEAESLDGITSLPAYQDAEGEDMPKIRRAPLTLLAAPALEAAEKADKAAANADEKASAAETATQSANEAAFNTNQAIQNAKTATDAANASASSANQATENANTAASNANSKATLADTAAANANDTAEHPTYIGEDHYVYKWDKTAKAYDKTDIYTKGDAFSIKKVYASVAELEADKSNPDIAEGDFVLVNTGDVEDPDNAKLYVKAGGDYEFLVDMSGAIGFTGKTPQFSMGTVTTLEAGASATATVSSDGTDEGGNPKYKLNFAIPRGNPGAPFNPVGQYDTLELLKQAIPDGSDVDGMIAVGTEAPYDYYAWLNGKWVSQGKVTGGNVIILPKEILDLTYQSTSEEILAVFGGIDKYKALMEKMSTGSWLVQIGEAVLGSGRFIYTIADYYVSLSSNKLTGSISLNVYNEQNQLRRFHFYLENNGTTARCGEASTFQLVRDTDVLTKTNTSPFTPTGDYQPAPKKYVDDKDRIANIPYSLFGLTSKSSSSQILGVFGGLSSYKSFVNKLRANNCVIVCGSPEDDSYRYVFDNYVTEWTDENNFNLYMYDNSLRSNLPKAFAFQIKLVNNEASFAKEERDFAIASDVLTKDNTTEYTPTSDYNPAPKAYVDNSISNSRGVGYMMQLTEIDASGLDENTWYPVTIAFGERNTIRIEVIVSLDSNTHPSWATHERGFSLRKIWEVNALAWGVNHGVNRQIFVSDYSFADIDPVRGISQLTNSGVEYVFVRGGGKYFFYVSHNAEVILRTERYEISSQSVSPTTETPAEIIANMATKEYVDEKISNIFDLEGFNFKTATQSKKEEFIKWIKGTNQVAHINHDAAQPVDDLYIPVSNYKHSDYGVGEEIILNFIAINCRDLNIDALIYISVYNSDTGVIDLNSTVTIDIKRYNIDPDYIKRTIITSDNLTTITKKTSGEYEALTKDDKTMYAVTD